MRVITQVGTMLTTVPRKNTKRPNAHTTITKPSKQPFLSMARALKKLAANRLSTIIGLALFVIIGFVLFGVVQKVHNSSKISVLDSRITTDDELLREYIKVHGPEKAIGLIKSVPSVDCHQRVHKVGRFNYDLANTKAFSTLNSECMSGYTHGATEGFFTEHGTDNLDQNLRIICPDGQNGFYAHQCYHGVGHGLMAYTDYELPEALELCDLLPEHLTSYESCYSGVYMENVVGAIALDEAKQTTDLTQTHVTSYLNDDPLFPCNVVKEKYKNACYIFQTSRMIVLFQYDFQKVASACQTVEQKYVFNCFLSMGRDVSNMAGSGYAQIETGCNYPTDQFWQHTCIAGATQDRFWDKTEQDDAIGLCKALRREDFKAKCYDELTGRARDIVSDSNDKKTFCGKYEHAYKERCVI